MLLVRLDGSFEVLMQGVNLLTGVPDVAVGVGGLLAGQLVAAA